MKFHTDIAKQVEDLARTLKEENYQLFLKEQLQRGCDIHYTFGSPLKKQRQSRFLRKKFCIFLMCVSDLYTNRHSYSAARLSSNEVDIFKKISNETFEKAFNQVNLKP